MTDPNNSAVSNPDVVVTDVKRITELLLKIQEVTQGHTAIEIGQAMTHMVFQMGYDAGLAAQLEDIADQAKGGTNGRASLD